MKSRAYSALVALSLVHMGSATYCPVRFQVSFDMMTQVLRTNGKVVSNMFTDHQLQSSSVDATLMKSLQTKGVSITDTRFSLRLPSEGWFPEVYDAAAYYNDEKTMKVVFKKVQVSGALNINGKPA